MGRDLLIKMEDEDTKFCTNCKKDISASNFVMHEMHCRRHIVLCDFCQEPIPRSELDQHFNEVHKKVPCDLCQTDVAKEEMEEHKKNVCSKTPVHCEFCELSVARDSIESHIDYCGSRTECCPLCQQYVMLKDMMRHESSGCTYPEPKPTPSNQTSSSSLPTTHDPFSMADLHEFLESDFADANIPDIPDFTSGLRRELLRNQNVPSRTSNSSRGNVPKLSNTRRGQHRQNNRSVNTYANKQRDAVKANTRNMSSELAIPPDMDYDCMLALQVAQEEMQKEANNDSQWSYAPDSAGVHRRLAPPEEVDNMTIPCEFCNLEIPLDMYIEHSDYCQQEQLTTDPSSSTDRNNTVSSSIQGQRSSIPVIDNLRPSLRDDGLSDTIPDSYNVDEDYSLPCEFCEDMFPSELIIQHQVVCPANVTATPRAVTPAAGLRKDQQKNRGSHQMNVSDDVSFLASGQLDMDVESDDDQTDNFFRDESYKNPLQSSSIKYGRSNLSRFDESSIRKPQRSWRQSSRGEDEEDSVSHGGSSQPPRENRSAQRARTRLNQLLQDDSEDKQQPSNGGRQGRLHGNDVNNFPSRATRHNSRGASRGYGRGAGVSSRTVMRELERGSDVTGSPKNSSRKSSNRSSHQPLPNGQTSFQSTPSRSRTSRNTGDEAQATQSSSLSNRSRQRSDHLFSPELRPKPQDSRRH